MQRWLHIGLVLLLGCGYVASERVLRAHAYPDPAGEGKASYDQLMANLPGFIQAPLANRREVLDLEDAVLKEEDPVKRATILYQLSSKVDNTATQRDYFRQIVEAVPDQPLAARARIGILIQQPDAAAVTEYLNYIDGCRFANEAQIADTWSLGYGLAIKAPPGARLLYLTQMAEVPIVGAGFVDAYETMERLTFELDRPDLRPLAKERLDACRALEREQLERGM